MWIVPRNTTPPSHFYQDLAGNELRACAHGYSTSHSLKSIAGFTDNTLYMPLDNFLPN